MSTTFTVTIDSASNLDHLRAMAAMRAEKFFEKTPFEITEVKAAPQPGSTHAYDGKVTMTAVTDGGEDETGRTMGFTGLGDTPAGVEEDIIRQAREIFGQDAVLRVSRDYALGRAAEGSQASRNSGKLLSGHATVSVIEPASGVTLPG